MFRSKPEDEPAKWALHALPDLKPISGIVECGITVFGTLSFPIRASQGKNGL
jgi:hypothetical protein